MILWPSSDPVLSIAFCYHGDFALHLLMTERLLKENLDNGLFETKITVAFVTSWEKQLN